MTTPRARKLLDALTADATTSMGRGRLDFLALNPGGSTIGPEAELARERLKRTRHRRLPKDLTGPPSPTAFPTVADGDKRDLTAGEIAWLQSLPADPREVAPDDAGLLDHLARLVRTPVERQMVQSRAVPVKTVYEAREELHRAERELATLPTPGDPTREPDWPRWRRLIAEEIRTETPELTPDEAEFRATRLATEAWQAKANTDKRNDLRARIGELCREHDLEPTLHEGAKRWGVIGDDNAARLRPVDDDDLPGWARLHLVDDLPGDAA